MTTEAVQGAALTATAVRQVVRPQRIATVVIAGGDLSIAAVVAAVVNPTPLGALFLAAAVVVLLGSGSVRARVTLRALEAAPRVLQRLGLPLLAAVPVALVSTEGEALLVQAVMTPLAIAGVRGISYAAVRSLRRNGVLAEAAVIVGSGAVADDLAAALRDHPELGLRVVGRLDDTPGPPGTPWLGPLSSLAQVVADLGVRQVLIAFSQSREVDYLELVREAAAGGAEIAVVPRFFEAVAAGDGASDEAWGIPLQRISLGVARGLRGRSKRAMDVTVALVALVLLLPVMAAVALAVRLSSPGPVLFRQVRIGQHGRPFELLKFRSMMVNDDADRRWSVLDDPRLTPVGRFLRRTNLDELPQLWNILRGDMSLVGPRPERPYFVEEFGRSVPSYTARHRVPVGLTGWAQVHGLRGPETSMEERVRFDNQYIHRWSLWRDLAIVLRTVVAMLKVGSD